MTFARDTSPGYMINLLARLMEQALARAIRDLGVVPGQFPVLLALWETDGLTQGALCRQVAVEQPTMSNTLKRMERDGLILRVADPADRRTARVHLTARARDLKAALTARAATVNATACAGMTAEEVEELLVLLGRMVGNLSPGGAR